MIFIICGIPYILFQSTSTGKYFDNFMQVTERTAQDLATCPENEKNPKT